MQFLFPQYLWALFLIAIPIIIHLFYFRRYKKVLFSNTSFLEEVKDERSSRNKLKHLLVLASRIAAIIFMVLAFAQPFIPNKNSSIHSQNIISLFIDNSFSMNAEGSNQLLFDEAKQSVKGLVENCSDDTRFQVLTQDFEGKHQRLISKAEALGALDEVKISPSSQSFKNIFERQLSVLNNESAEKSIYLFSDFQKNQELFNNDTSVSVNLVALTPSNIRNVYIDSVWFEAPVQLVGQNNQLSVRFKNEGNEEVSGNYQLSLNDVSKSVGNYNVPAKGAQIDTIAFSISETGWNRGVIALNDFPITFDDDYYFSFEVVSEVNVLSIGEKTTSPIFQAIFKDLEQVNFISSSLSTVDYSNLTEQHLIILNQLSDIPSGLSAALEEFLIGGGNVFVAPSNQISTASYNQFLNTVKVGTINGVNDATRDVTEINLQHPVLIDLFDNIPNNLKLPRVTRHFRVGSSSNVLSEPILAFRNGDPFLQSYTVDAGQLFLLTAPLSKTYSDFVTHPIFAPTIYKMAVLGVNSANIAHDIEASTFVKLNGSTKSSDEVLSLNKDEVEIIPNQLFNKSKVILQTKGALLESGFYEVRSNKSDFFELVALNYSRQESEMEYYAQDDLRASYPESNIAVMSNNIVEINESVKLLDKGKSLWKWFVIIALVFLFIEIILLRLWK